MKKLVYILVTVLLVLTACTGTSRHPQLVAADSLLLTQPDSALTLLRSMSFSSTADRMYHYLLLADACNKCYDTLPSDSILQEVADYYDRHGSANEQVRAHYLLGCAYRDQGNAPLALNYYRIASEKADTLAANCDFLTLSRVYGQIAVLFHTQRAPKLEIIVLHLHKMASNAQKASAVEWRDLNCLALEKLPSFINVICDESVQLTDKEIKVCILTRLHFIPTEMVALLDLTKQRITNIRANANRKLFNKEGAGSFDINIHNI